jgi:hypothetical protein
MRKAATDFLTANGIVTRDQWNARTSKIDPGQAENLDWDYNTLVIHHSGRSGETDPVKIQNKHMDKNKWDDVGYHFLVHPDGTIYEGRSLVFKGSHVEKANTGKIGILVMGNFESLLFGLGGSTPTVAQMAAVKKLGMALKKLFPTIQVLGGHKDFKKSTECPGEDVPAPRRIPHGAESQGSMTRPASRGAARMASRERLRPGPQTVGASPCDPPDVSYPCPCWPRPWPVRLGPTIPPRRRGGQRRGSRSSMAAISRVGTSSWMGGRIRMRIGSSRCTTA